MKTIVDTIQKNLKFKIKAYTIDNFVFKCHYRITMGLMLIMTILITSQELIGEHIKCFSQPIKDPPIPEAILNRYCFFMSTFTVVKYLNDTLVRSFEIAHPGVGPIGMHNEDPIKRHAYYQWVPFVMFGQALMFYLPHYIWKQKENKRIEKLVDGLHYAAFATDKSMKVGEIDVPDHKKVKAEFDKLKIYFYDHLVVNRSWTTWLILCELLNFLNVIFQICLTNWFLNGDFMSLGSKIMKEGLESEVDILDIVFPKMTKCTFHKYGPSGSIQAHDALCVMALNIINEKAYAVLWFWFLILFIITSLGLIWRLTTILLYNRSVEVNRAVFSMANPSYQNPWHVLSIAKQCSYHDWLFLVYLAKNIDGLVFTKFFKGLALDLSPNYSNYNGKDEDSVPFDLYTDKLQ